jgi:hypothetical protein
MNIKTIIAIAFLSFGLTAAADDQIVSLAYEIKLSEFHAPATSNGSASFKECEDCTRHLVRVTEATRYSINGKNVRLADFKEACMLANDRDKKSLTVLHHLESDTIQSIDAFL